VTDLLTELGKIAGVLALLGYVPYLMSIVRRKTLPNPATWWIWSIMGGILFASYYLEGNREAVWVPLSYFIGPTVTGILSIKYGRNEFGTFEKYCLGGAALSLVLWQVSGPVVALTMLIMIDLIAIAPTLRKTYFKPDSEDPLAWSIFWLANTINLFVVVASEAPTYASIAYPLELFFLPTSIMALVIRGKVVGLSISPTKRQRQQEKYIPPAAISNSRPLQQYDSVSATTSSPAAAASTTPPVAPFKAPENSEPFDASLNQLVRQGARKIISQAVTAELNELLAQQGIPHTSASKISKAEINNIENSEATVTASNRENSPVEESAPSHIGENAFTALSELEAVDQQSLRLTPQALPPYLHGNCDPEEFLPWLYLKGTLQADFNSQLASLLGADVAPWSVAAINQIQETWNVEYQDWQQRSLARSHYAYIWADSIRFDRTETALPCVLIIVGASADGYIELLGLKAGNPSLKADWEALLLQLKSQGLTRSPQLAVGNNNPSLWQALSHVFPATQQQECWNAKTNSIFQQLPAKLQPRVNKALWEIYRAETQSDAVEALKQFIKTYQTKYPEATNCLTENREALLTFYSFPAEHWPTLRNNSLIDSVFATLRVNTLKQPRELLNQAENVVSESATTQGLPPAAFKLVQGAAKQWQRIRSVKYLGDVIEGISFSDGIRVESTVENPLDGQTAA